MTRRAVPTADAADARYLVIGSRAATDTIPYPDHDLITHKDGPARRDRRGDGSPVHRRQQ